MIGERELRAAAERALRLAEKDGRQAEVLLVAQDSALTRYANNEIHQHVSESGVTAGVRVAIGKRVGTASVTGLEAAALERAVEQATTAAQLQRENPDFAGFPGPHALPAASHGLDEQTLAATPEARADKVAVVCGRAQRTGFVAAGACSTSLVERAVANSTGTFGYEATTHAMLQAVVVGETSSGYSVRQGSGFESLDAETVAEEAAGKAERGRDPIDLEPGIYDVVLEPYAAEDILRFVAALGLQGRAVLDRTSFAAGRIGERLLSEQVTLRDDPLDPSGVPQTFDDEGVPKQPLTLIDGGVINAVTYDSLTAAKAGAKTTGHAQLGASFFGPAARHLYLAPGELDRQALIRTIDRGLLITRFWYTRPVHPLSITVTGMTRDSTFLIERGEISRPVKNLRFTQSYVQALQQVAGIGRDVLLVGDSYGHPLRSPALALRGFTFTGKSEY